MGPRGLHVALRGLAQRHGAITLRHAGFIHPRISAPHGDTLPSLKRSPAFQGPHVIFCMPNRTKRILLVRPRWEGGDTHQPRVRHITGMRILSWLPNRDPTSYSARAQ
jgi:hypothetical protein